MLEVSSMWKKVSKGLSDGDKVLVAVSGGADSVALLHLVLPPIEERSRLIIGHVHHGTGQFADDSAALVEKLAHELDVTCRITHVTIPEEQEKQFGFEAAARFERYQALERMAEIEGCARCLTAHTLDDQAESFLMAAMRGAGLGGLQGVREVRECWERPLLSLRHEDLCNFLQRNNIQWIEDPANQDEQYTRVKVRKQLAPMIRNLYGDGAWENIARSAHQVAEADEVLSGHAKDGMTYVLRGSTQRWISVDAKLLLGYFADTRDRILRLAWCHAAGMTETTSYFDRAERKLLVNALESKPGDRFTLGDVTLRKTDSRLIFDGLSSSAPIRTALPTTVTLGDGSLVAIELCDADSQNRPESVPGRVELLDADLLGNEVVIRPWVEGDRFIPLGRPDSEVKVPRALRTKPGERIGILWVLESRGGQIANVFGERIADPFKVRSETRTYAKVSFTPPSERVTE